MMIAGVDVGLSGAIAVIDGEGVPKVWDLPVHITQRTGNKRAELDVHTLTMILKDAAPDHVVIEAVGPMPKQGISSTSRFMYAAGAIYGAVVALGIAVSFVRPQDWQRHHHIGRGPDDALRRCLQLYPGIADQLRRRRDNHRADALLIAAYGMVLLNAERSAAA
jgi:crossover junction endodeoxyribonuclease RuvC